MIHMSKTQIHAYEADALPSCNPLRVARKTMQQTGCWGSAQQMGRRWPIGCVALEITQRCNLDCSLCYLSEHSEAVQDIPLAEVLRRIQMIYDYYGEHTDVQITGGDPTLRKRDELLAIVARVRELGMRPTLMTNGIKARRPLLQALAAAGLVDVVFHVDTTQNIKGYHTEMELNAIRKTYIQRCRGLPLSVMFNTTVHKGNYHEIPDLVRFFKAHAAWVRTASFQLQADTGRGIQGKRDTLISIDSVREQIQKGAGTLINFTASAVGHPSCNRYGLCLEINGALYDFFDDSTFIAHMQAATAGLQWDRSHRQKTMTTFARWLLTHPRYLYSWLCWVAPRVWRMKKDLWAARGRVHTLSFFIHNFMDADALEAERIQGCVFKTMTGDGPLSMCMHNAKRDAFILKPVAMDTAEGKRYWQPLTGEIGEQAETLRVPQVPLKRLKGRTKQRVLNRV